MPDSILIRAPNWIGDAVIATGFIDACRKKHTESRLTVLAHQRVAALFEANPSIDEIAPFGNDDGIWELAQSVKQRGFVRAYIMPLSLSSALICRLAGIRDRIGYASELRGPLLTKSLPYSRTGFRSVHLLNGYLGLLGEGVTAMPPMLFLTSSETEMATDLLTRAGINPKESVGFGPGATYGPAKMWPKENWVELGRRLAGKGKRILIFGSHSEQGLCRDIALGIGEGTLNLAGRANLRESAALLGQLPQFVSNDTGVMHLAAAAGSRVTAIFCSTNPLWTGPWGKSHQVLKTNLPCSPCYRRKCRYGHYNCLKNITTDHVLERALAPA